MYVKHIRISLLKLFSAISADKGDNLAAELYNIVTGTGSERIGVTGTDIINNSSDEQQYIKTGTYYGQIEANVQLINRMPYDNVYKMIHSQYIRHRHL